MQHSPAILNDYRSFLELPLEFLSDIPFDKEDFTEFLICLDKKPILKIKEITIKGKILIEVVPIRYEFLKVSGLPDAIYEAESFPATGTVDIKFVTTNNEKVTLPLAAFKKRSEVVTFTRR